MKIILNKDNVIVASGSEVRTVENGIFVDGVIYAEHGLTVAETSQEFEIQKNKFEGGSVVPNPNYVAPQMSEAELLQQFKSAKQVYAETAPTSVSLDAYKALRIEALKEDCTEAIYEGFNSPSTGAAFGFNQNDQMNFTQLSVRILAAGGASAYTKPIQWKTKSGAIVTLTLEQFNKLLDEAEAHKIEKQTKFWQLEAQVLAAKDAGQVKAINW